MKFLLDESGERIDSYLATQLSLSRSYLASCIRQGIVQVNQNRVKPSYILKQGDEIFFDDLIVPQKKPIQAEFIPLSIIYEDDHLIVIDKPTGMTTHPSHHQQSGTLVNALMAHCSSLSDTQGAERPGIVHRLDRDTSGVMVAAKHNQAHRYMAELFSKRKIEKTYLAVCEGYFPHPFARITLPIGKFPEKSCMKVSSRGKPAITDVTLLEHLKSHSLLSILIHTGRTHQIRVHLSYIGHPVCGDTVYGSASEYASRMMLHSWKLSFVPYGATEKKEFIAPIPDTMQKTIEDLRQ